MPGNLFKPAELAELILKSFKELQAQKEKSFALDIRTDSQETRQQQCPLK